MARKLDEMTIDELGARRDALRAETTKVTARLRDLVVAAVDAGEMSQAEAVRRSGVDRMVVRKWLGLGPRA